jgi:hypothetical protein
VSRLGTAKKSGGVHEDHTKTATYRLFPGEAPFPHRKSPPKRNEGDDSGADTAEERQKRRRHFREGYLGELRRGKSPPERNKDDENGADCASRRCDFFRAG